MYALGPFRIKTTDTTRHHTTRHHTHHNSHKPTRHQKVPMERINDNKNQTSDEESEFESESGDFNILNQRYSSNSNFQNNNQSAHVNSSESNETIKKRKRSPWAKPSKAVKWTDDMDERLKEAVIHYPKDWVKAAQHVGCEVKKDQCRHRWNMYVDPATSQLNRGQWTAEEEANLRIYVSNHENIKSTRKIPVGMIDWSESVVLLGRSPTDCQHKWTSMRQSVLRKGPWTPEEDKVILQRVREWADKGQGLWASLEREIGRSARNILSRWKSNLSLILPSPTVPVSLTTTYQPHHQPTNLNVISSFHNNPSIQEYDYSQILSSGSSRIKLPTTLQQQQHQSQTAFNVLQQPPIQHSSPPQPMQLLPLIPTLPAIPSVMYSLPSPAPDTMSSVKHHVV